MILAKDVKPGISIIAEDGHDCLEEGAVLMVHAYKDGPYVSCKDGIHHLAFDLNVEKGVHVLHGFRNVEDEIPSALKRFVLFGGDVYYPFGGADDIKGSFDTLEEAVSKGDELQEAEAGSNQIQWWQIVDLTTGKAVQKSECQPYG